jgi:hypothetical protein
MGFRVRSLAPVVLALALQKTAGAQRLATAPIDSGTVIRMHLGNAKTVRGRLLQTFTPSSSTLTFCRYPGTPCANLSDQHVDSLPASRITCLDVAHGNHLLNGVVIGGLTSLAVAGALILTFGQLCDATNCAESNRRVALGTIALGVGLGVAFGSQSVRWRSAP